MATWTNLLNMPLSAIHIGTLQLSLRTQGVTAVRVCVSDESLQGAAETDPVYLAKLRDMKHNRATCQYTINNKNFE